MFKIKLSNLKINASHGYYSFEHEKEQKFVINIEVYFEDKEIKEGEIGDTVNYEILRSIVFKIFADHKYKLLEVLTRDIQENIKNRFIFLNI